MVVSPASSFAFFFGKPTPNEKPANVIFTYLHVTQDATIRHTYPLIHGRLSPSGNYTFPNPLQRISRLSMYMTFLSIQFVEWCGSGCFYLPLYPHYGGRITWPDFLVMNIGLENLWNKNCNLLVNVNKLWPLYLLGTFFNICWNWFCSVLNVKLNVVKLWQLNFSPIYGCVYVILCIMHTISRTCSLSGMGTIT